MIDSYLAIRMLYSDWLKNFEQVQICNLSPDSFEGQLTAQQVKKRPILNDSNMFRKIYD